MTSICEKKVSAEARLIHVEQISSYYGIVETVCRPFLFHAMAKRIATQILVITKLNHYKIKLQN